MSSTKHEQGVSQAFDAKGLMQQARAKSGLSDFGDEGFVKALETLLACVRKEDRYHSQGLKEFRNGIVQTLINRLRFQDDLKRHPEILDEDVSDPIIIIGLPRSGTTKTQRLIGTDRNLLKTYLWQLINPAPFPNAVSGQRDPRIAAASMGEPLADGSDGLHASHHFSADHVEEDAFLFNFTFNSIFNSNRDNSTSFLDWLMSRQEPADIDNYRYVRSLFQYLQWQQGGRQGRRWLMKNTYHIAHMGELLEVYPNATLLHVHRHPADCLPSNARLMMGIWALREEHADPIACGRDLFRWSKMAIDKYLAARESLGLDDSIYDVQYSQIRDDPMPVVREIYRRAGQRLTTEAEQRMLKWENENEQYRYGKSVYTLEEFGFNRQEIGSAFGEYIRRFLSVN